MTKIFPPRNLSVEYHILFSAAIHYSREKMLLIYPYVEAEEYKQVQRYLESVVHHLFMLERSLRQIFDEEYGYKSNFNYRAPYLCNIPYICGLTRNIEICDPALDYNRRPHPILPTLKEHDQIGSIMQSNYDLFHLWKSYFRDIFPDNPQPAESCNCLCLHIKTFQHAMITSMRDLFPHQPNTLLAAIYKREGRNDYIPLNDSFPDIAPHSLKIKKILNQSYEPGKEVQS